MTTATVDKLRLYRSRHRIVEVDGRCATDGIRVLPKRGSGLRHHPDDISQLVADQYHETHDLSDRYDPSCRECERDMDRAQDAEGA